MRHVREIAKSRNAIPIERRPSPGRRIPVGRGTRLRRGSVLIWSAVSTAVVGGIAALAFDMSRARAAKGELEAAADAAAMNGANGLTDNTYLAKAQAAAAENKCDGTAVALASADVIVGNWTGTAFTVNGTPRNAIRVTASRTTAGGNPIRTYLSEILGRTAVDVRATATVSVVKQADYEWVGLDGVSLDGGNALFTISSYDATNPSAASGTTTVKTGGAITMTGPVRLEGDVRYGTSANIAPASKVSGTVAKATQSLTYPSGSQVANLSGVTPVYATTYDLNVSSNMTLSGGTYVIKNCNVSDCTITFSGPATIIMTGDFNMTNGGFATYNNLPANLKVISTGTDTSINFTNLTRALTADFYAPGSTFTLDAPNGYYGMSGRGVFKRMTISGKGANSPIRYDRSMTQSSSLSQKAMIVD
jgi:hypothetical protein